MTITAEIIADSISETRLTTLKLRYPRFIHSEFMTHRTFSRNAGSSRAIPVERMIQDVIDDPAMPIHWGANQKGMQARKELCPSIVPFAKTAWLAAMEKAVGEARYLTKLGAHKQIVNRLLEPYAHITVLVTATDWGNFFEQRLHPDAQPEIHELARVMLQELEHHHPRRLKHGEWHLPYTKEMQFPLDDFKMLSAARCARVSYDRAGEGEVELAKRLLEQKHPSPFEHQATPAWGRYANFNGWKSFRWELGI